MTEDVLTVHLRIAWVLGRGWIARVSPHTTENKIKLNTELFVKYNDLNSNSA